MGEGTRPKRATGHKLLASFLVEPFPVKGYLGDVKTILALCLVSLTLSGCAILDKATSGYTEQNLSAAGFRAQYADTPAKQAALQTMKPYQVVLTPRGGKPFYSYADPKKNLLYIGSQKEYGAYQKLLIQQDVASEEELASMQQETAAMDWDMWYPWVW